VIVFQCSAFSIRFKNIFYVVSMSKINMNLYIRFEVFTGVKTQWALGLQRFDIC
jgi:hypothetical protein